MLRFLILSIVFSLFLSAKTTIIESNNNYILFSYSPDLQGFEEIKTADGFITYIPKIKSAYQNNDLAGSPMRFVHSELIAIPNENTYKVELLSQPELNEIDAMMAPVRNIFSNDNLNGEYRIGKNYFSNSPASNLNYEYVGIIGNNKFIRVNFDAAYFDNQLSSIVVPKEFVIKVNYNSPISKSENKNKFKNNFNFLNKNVAHNWTTTTFDKNVSQFLNDEKIYSDGDWYKIKIDKDGVYRITASQLSNNGINIPKEKINTIKIIGNGGYPLSS